MALQWHTGRFQQGIVIRRVDQCINGVVLSLTCVSRCDSVQSQKWRWSPPCIWRTLVRVATTCVLIYSWTARAHSVTASDEALRFFENEVRPILVERCSGCHGEQKQSSGLRVDSWHGLMAGERGPAIVPGDPDASLLIKVVRREGGLQMPPKEKLTDREVMALSRWIKQGAPWPKSLPDQSSQISTKAKKHWAFQPILEPASPEVHGVEWIRTPVDTFVLAKLEKNGLPRSPPADRRTLVRRVAHTLTGLPPPSKLLNLTADGAPDWYDRVVDHLLESPHYGELWGRHWLDVARYSDSKGYVYAREERFWVHAWTYRDWVVRVLNNDMPYNRFLLLQLAADQVEDCETDDLAAMGFLTLGRRFLGIHRLITDDRIDVVSRGTMGLTVGCARCHDHKYDPIPTADYYSLYGVFDSCAEQLVALTDNRDDTAWHKELQNRQEKLATKTAASRQEWSALVRQRVADYLMAQMELHKYPAAGFDQFFYKSDILPAFVWRWEDYLHQAELRGDPVFVPWHSYTAIPKGLFAEQAEEVTRRIRESSDEMVNPIVASAFREVPASMTEVAQNYGAVFSKIDARWQSLLKSSNPEPPAGFSEEVAEQLRRVLYGPGAPCEIPDEPVVHTERFFDTATCVALWNLQGEVDRWIKGKAQARYALTLVDRLKIREPRIFRRGNPVDKGDDVPRRFLSLFAGDQNDTFKHGSGRLELAKAIVNPSNPLTARVIVNRVWAHHFGVGLVSTPSDFGLRADQPSHPLLLDWLAARFVDGGWSLKKLHRWIVLSATFRQSSAGIIDPVIRAKALKTDPANRLLWRMNHRRLTLEQFRDSMLVASGELDRKIGGKPVDLFQQPHPKRRTLYGLVDRQFLPSTLRVFDFANPDLHVPQRSETTVPQQALFFMNHPLILDQARALARAIEANATPETTVKALFQRACLRDPTDKEMYESLALVGAVEDEVNSDSNESQLGPWEQLAQVLLCGNEFLFVD